MRSRDGNNPFSLTIWAVAFLVSLPLYGSEYLISYRSVVKNAMLYNENLFVSKTMQKCEGQEQEPIIFSNKNHQSLKKILSNSNEEFIEYLHRLGLLVQHKEEKSNFNHTSTTILTLKTRCFKVDFNEDFVTIAPIN